MTFHPTTRTHFLLIALTALGIAATPLACAEDFSNCLHTATCPADGDAGEGGAAADGEGEGGGGGVPGGGGGAGVGEGGVGGDHAPFGILEVTPEDGATDVERTPTIHVTFSADVDEESISEESVRLEGPQGPIPVSRSVAGNELTMVPEQPLALLGSYTIALDDTLRSATGVALGESTSFRFRARDGAFRVAERIASGEMISVQYRDSPDGHIAIMWDTNDVVQAVVRDAAVGEWSTVRDVDDTPGQVTALSLSINDKADVLLSWSRLANGGGTARYLASAGWQNAIDHQGPRRAVLLEDGAIVGIWPETPGSSRLLFSVIGPGTHAWSDPELFRDEAFLIGLLPFGNNARAVFTTEGGRLWHRQYDQQSGWAPAQLLTDETMGLDHWSATVQAAHQLTISWKDTNGVWALIADGITTTTDLVSHGTAAYPALSVNEASQALLTWIESDATRVALRSVDGSWGVSEELGAFPGDKFMGASPGLDADGNGLVAWGPHGPIAVRRYTADTGWSTPPDAPSAQANMVFVTTRPSGDSTLVWYNATGLWAAEFD